MTRNPGLADRLLTDEARDLLAEERAVLSGLRELLLSHSADEEDVRLLRQAELDLDELFLLVVVGEFNAGKSAFVNALIGERVLREGVTPTTAAITRLRYGTSQMERREGPMLEVLYPLELLRDVAIVDTPGTNAILREHEEITSHFVPRADLVLFVTSADRPFPETERAFMERIRSWGKKVVVVLNKADLLEGEEDLAAQLAFVREHVERLLGFSPEVFPVSSRLALLAKAEQEPARREELFRASRFESLERFVLETLDPERRLQLKLASPLGVAERVAQTYVLAGEEKRRLLAHDIQVVEALEEQIGEYRDQMRRDFELRVAQVDGILRELSRRGLEYLDETLRLRRVPELFRQERIRKEFERVVVADTPERIDRATQDVIDWMVDQDLKLWRSVSDQLEQRRRLGVGEGPAARLAGSFEYDRRSLLGSLAGTARDVIQRHNHPREAEQLARSVRDAVTQATLIEAGALGLGAVSAALAGGIAVDATGLFAAGVLAGFGLWLLPRKRRQAREQFRAGTDELRTRLTTAIRDEFQRELERGIQRVKDALAPYERYVRGEHERTRRFLADLEESIARLHDLRARIERLRPTAA